MNGVFHCYIHYQGRIRNWLRNRRKFTLSEIHRVLRPHGKLIFIEHVAAQDNPNRLKWQRRLGPLWKRIACGCHLTRSTEKSMVYAGLMFDEITHQSIRGVPPIVRPSIKGIVRKIVF